MLTLRIQLQLILHRLAQRQLKGITVGIAAVLALRIVPQIGLEDPRSTDRQKVLIHQRFEVHMAGIDQAVQ
ncbi:hypothetical protein D3C71_2173110 [compost metagenome]